MQTKSISRRQLLKGTGALIVSFNLFEPMARVLAQTGAPLYSGPQATSLDSWLAVARDGSVTVFTSKVDLGTGIETALAQIVAEELDVPFGRIRMDVGDTSKTIDQAATVGSRTIERGGPQLRQAAAAARQALLKMASARLGVSPAQLSVRDGVVSVAGDAAKSVSYASLVGGRRFGVHITATGSGWDLKVAPEVRPKDPKDYRIVGTSVPRIDLPPKFTGEFTYTQDVRIPGMLHGRVVRPPVVNSKPVRVDEESIRHVSGVVKVVQEGSFVGVVARTEWAAIQAAKGLKVTWSTPATKLPANRAELYDHLENTKPFREQVAADRGDSTAGVSQASKSFAATFRWPFQMHGMLGPSCAVADVRGEKATIWAGSQGPFRTRQNVAKLLGVPEENVRVIYRESPGCYGRLSPDDVPEDAALMSRAVGRPVRVQWMRHDEHGWEPKGPAQLMKVRAGVDAQGKVTAWLFEDRSFPWTTGRGIPLLASRQIGLKPSDQGNTNGTGGGGQIYDFENLRVAAEGIPWVHQDPTPLRTSNLRAPGDMARCFASESFVDEIASAFEIDPVEFRLRYLSNKRLRDVLEAAVKKAGWEKHASPAPAGTGSKVAGRGVAVANRSNTMTAAIAEVEVDKSTGEVAVRRITLAQDCGLIVNPDGVTNQIEGNVIQGVSRTLLEEVQFDSSGVKSLDWVSYPILRFHQVPKVDVVLINRPEMPALGSGEPSIVPVSAAIANAVFDAAGVRLREIPITPQRILGALQSGIRAGDQGA
jgi:nicotinate dehydrogenase subunit B